MGKKMSLYKVLKGIARGTGYAASTAAGYAVGTYVGHKVYDQTGDCVVAGVAGGMSGIAVAHAGDSLVDLGLAKVDTAVKRKENEKLAAEADI